MGRGLSAFASLALIDDDFGEFLTAGAVTLALWITAGTQRKLREWRDRGSERACPRHSEH